MRDHWQEAVDEGLLTTGVAKAGHASTFRHAHDGGDRSFMTPACPTAVLRRHGMTRRRYGT
jgi:hypothetical protein